THRGLARPIVESVRLHAGQGLARWLAAQGRPARLHDLTDPEIVRELKLLQSVLAVPLLAHGEPVAILTVGPPVVRPRYGRHEIQLALRGLWLEVSTYPVRGEDGAPLGAVLVFEDLTAQKELLTQKRQVEQTQLLTRVVARIADEIKNPLVSINTFIELIG